MELDVGILSEYRRDVPANEDPTATGPGSLRKAAYLAIRDEILRHEIRPLSLLKEPALAKRLGMSRTPVRSALEMLVSDGLVSWSPGIGYVVDQLTARTITEVFEVRTAIETFAVRNSKDNQLRGAAAKYAAFFAHYGARGDEEIPVGEWRLLQEADRMFHEDLVRCLRNSFALGVSDKVALRAAYLRGWSMSRPGRARDAAREHLAIVDALRHDDNETAAVLLAEHLERGRTILIELLAQHWEGAAPVAVYVGGDGAFAQWLGNAALGPETVESLILGVAAAT